MSLLDVYVSEDTDNALFEVELFYPSTPLHRDLDVLNFTNLHKKTLFNLSNRLCLMVPKDLTYENAVSILEGRVDKDVIWVFEKLAKNTKLYKYLFKTYKVTFCSEIIKDREKNAFIKELAKSIGVKAKYISEFSKRSGTSKRVIQSELEKLYAAQEILSNPLDIVVDDTNGLECFKFIDSLFEGDLVSSLLILEKLERFESGHKIAALLAKKTMSMMLICAGDINQANKYFRVPNNDYFKNKVINQAKGIGLKRLSSLHTKLQKEIITFSSKKPYFVLRQVVWEFCQNSM